MKCKDNIDGTYEIILTPKLKEQYKLVKQYPDSGHELGDIVKGEDLSLSAAYSDEFWEPVKNKFTRDEIIEIFKKNNAIITLNRQEIEKFEIDISVVSDFGLTINDFIK